MIYMDHAATTPTHPQVVEAMLPYFTQAYGNPSNVYSLSLNSRRAIDQARATVAECLGAKQASEIVFTGCGTESDNLALLGLARAHREEGNHVIISQIEHHAILHSAQQLEREGFRVTRVSVDNNGRVNPEQVAAALTPDTTVVSIMLANNEVGTIEPIAEVAQILKGHQAFLHTDAVQAVGAIPINVQELHVDALSLSAHKFFGPKGVGALYLRTGVKPLPVNYGGGQEHGLRSGTENVPGIVGLAKALQLATTNRAERSAAVAVKRDSLIAKMQAACPDAELTGHPTLRLPGSASFVFSDIEGESLLMQLNRKNICASAGSACASSALGISHVLQAMGVPAYKGRGSLRLTISEVTTDEEIDITVEAVAQAIAKLRALGPSSRRSNRPRH